MNQRDVLAQLALEGSVQWLLFQVSSKIDQVVLTMDSEFGDTN